MLHRTGPGKVKVEARYSGPGMIKAHLYNFDIDGDTIKPEHRMFLDRLFLRAYIHTAQRKHRFVC